LGSHHHQTLHPYCCTGSIFGYLLEVGQCFFFIYNLQGREMSAIIDGQKTERFLVSIAANPSTYFNLLLFVPAAIPKQLSYHYFFQYITPFSWLTSLTLLVYSKLFRQFFIHSNLRIIPSCRGINFKLNALFFYPYFPFFHLPSIINKHSLIVKQGYRAFWDCPATAGGEIFLGTSIILLNLEWSGKYQALFMSRRNFERVAFYGIATTAVWPCYLGISRMIGLSCHSCRPQVIE
jgi:hypothetical protein